MLKIVLKTIFCLILLSVALWFGGILLDNYVFNEQNIRFRQLFSVNPHIVPHYLINIGLLWIFGLAFLLLFRLKMGNLNKLRVLQKFAETGGHGFGWVDINFIIKYANPALLKLYGAEKLKDIVGKSLLDFYPQKDDIENKYVGKLLHEGAWKGELKVKRLNGEIRNVIHNVALIKDTDGNPLYFASGMTDITEQRDKEIQFRTLSVGIEQSPAITVITDEKGNIEYANPAFMEITGYTLEEVKGKNPRILKSGKMDEDEYRDLWATISSGKVWKGQFYNKRKDGTMYWEKAIISPVRDDNGKITHYLKKAEEVTVQKLVEKILEKERNQFRMMMDNIPDYIYFKDKQSRFTRVNSFLVESFDKCSDTEIIGKSDYDFFEKQYAEKSRRNEQRIMETGEPLVGIQEKQITKDGEVLWVSTTKMPLYDEEGNIAGTFGISRDITHYQLAEEKIKSLARFPDENPNAVLRVSKNFEILYSNNPGKPLEKFLRDSKGNGQKAEIHKKISDSYKTGQTTVFDYKLGDRTYSITLSPVEESGYINLYAMDITEKTQMENQLEKAVEDLQRSNEDLQQFAHVASHDLQEPLRMVTSYLQLLARRYQGKLDKDADDFIGFAVDGSKRMQNLILALLQYSRVGSQAKPFAICDMDQVVINSIKDLEPAIEQNKAEVTHDKLPVITADVTQMEQLLRNLINNALKYHAENVTPKIHVSAREEEDGWTFSVEDNGIGIQPEFFNRIFVIFQRLHNRNEYSGSGIGLSVCKRVVERHGGKIWVESTPGKGSTFYFKIPVIAVPQESEEKQLCGTSSV